MNGFFTTVVLPAYRLLSGRNILPHFKTAQARQWLSHSELLEIQAQGLRRLMVHAYENVPFYRRRFTGAGLTPGDIQKPEDLVKLPPLTKQELRADAADLIASNFRRRDLLSRSTGGSTGVPTAFYYDRNAWDCRVAAKYAAFTWAGWNFGARTAILTGSPIDRAVFQSIRGRLKSALFRELVLDTFEMSEQMRRQYIGQLQKFRPQLLIGYASACVSLAKQALADTAVLNIPAIITSAEMLFPDRRRLIERAFRGQIFDLYGSREAAAIGMECHLHTGFHLAIDRFVVEVVRDGQPVPVGQSGEIVITDLQNYGMPFIRYKIGDVGRYLGSECPCGRRMPLLQLTHGRITDIIITPDGKELPGEFFPHLFKELSTYVEQFQIVQERIDELVVKIVPAASYGQAQTDYVRTNIQEKLGPSVAVRFEFVKAIPPEPSGKHRVTISRLPSARSLGEGLPPSSKGK